MPRSEIRANTDLKRLRRLLFLMRCIASHSARGGHDAAEAAWHFNGRIGAVGRAALVPVECGVDLECLVRDELRECASGRLQDDIEGPDIRLNSSSAQLLSLALHELAINALKFGALCQENARLQVRWRRDNRYLRLEWREMDVQLTQQARRPGFGSELVQRLIASELRGRGEMVFSCEGLRCNIEVPLTEALHTDD